MIEQTKPLMSLANQPENPQENLFTDYSEAIRKQEQKENDRVEATYDDGATTEYNGESINLVPSQSVISAMK